MMRIEAKHNTIGPRILAGIIDVLVLSPIITLQIALDGAELSKWLLVFLAIVGSSVGNIYNVYLHGRFGKTLGKVVAKVKVVTTEEQPIGYFHAFMRDSPYIAFAALALGHEIFSILDKGTATSVQENLTWLDWFLVAFLIADIFVTLANNKRRSLHDFIGGTVVIRTNV